MRIGLQHPFTSTKLQTRSQSGPRYGSLGTLAANISLIPSKLSQPNQSAWNAIAGNSECHHRSTLFELDGGNEEGTILAKPPELLTPPHLTIPLRLPSINTWRKAKPVVICVQGQDGVTTQKHLYEFPNEKQRKVKKFTLTTSVENHHHRHEEPFRATSSNTASTGKENSRI